VFEHEWIIFHYCALVRPILEYGSVLWAYTVSNSNQIEPCSTEIFEICLFCVNGIPHLDHNNTNISNILDLPTLAERRSILNITFIRGLLTNQIDSPFLLSQINFKFPSHTSHSQKTFHISSTNINYLQNEPLRRMMSLANEDPLFDVSLC